MFRFVSMSIATLALSVLALSGAAAAPKADGAMCVAGVGRSVCCKAGVSDHCGHVSCCEVGNAAFFSAKSCGSTHSALSAKPVAHVHAAAKTEKVAGHGCATSSASCEVGNRGFFTQSACSSSAAKKAGAPAACCAGEAKAK